MEFLRTKGETFLKWILYATALIPLLYYQELYFPFIVAKAVYFRALVALALLLFALILIAGKRNWNWEIFKHKMTWLFSAIVLSSIISGLLGIDFFHSFWSSFQRMEGIVTLIFLFIYFLLLSLVFKEKDWHFFLKLNVWVGGVVIIYGIAQLLNLPGIVDKATDRIDSTLNNAAFFASYLLFLFYFSLYFIYKKEKLLFFYYATALLSIIFLFMTATRGAILGFLVSAFLFALYISYRSQNGLYKKTAIGAIVVLLVLAAGGLIFKSSLQNSNILFVKRLASISLEDRTTQSRLFIWGESLNYLKDKPLFGYGPENFEYVYNKFYNPDLIGEEWFDRSHNVYVDSLIHTGMVGFILYLLLIILIFKILWPKEGEWDKVIFLFLFISYLVQNFFVFDSITTLVLFYALVAFVIKNYDDKHIEASEFSYPKLVYPAATILIILSLSGVYFAAYKPLRANAYLYEGYQYQIVDYPRTENALRNGLDLNTFAELEYAYQMYTIYINQVSLKNQVGEENVKKSHQFLQSHVREMIKKYPWNTRLYVYLGHMNEVAPEGLRIADEEMIQLLNHAIELTPLRDQSRYMLANIYLTQLQNEKDASKKKVIEDNVIKTLEDYIEALPHAAEPKIVLANFLFDIGRTQEAETVFAEGMKTYKEDQLLTRRVIDFYLKKKDYVNAEKYYFILTKLSPENLDYHFDLGYLYFLNGKLEDAIEKVNYVRARNPKTLERNPNFVNNIMFNVEMQNKANNIE